MTWFYHAADIFFMVFHSGLILLNLFGWAWKPLRRANFIALALTGGSWFILGIFYGIGYCPFTDWHFQVLYELGRYPESNSYIGYMLERVSGISFKATVVDTWTMILFFAALGLSIYFNFFRKK